MKFKTFYNEMKLLSEAVSMTSIPHFDQMNIDQLLTFFNDNFDQNNLEITEKVDGANFSLLMLGGKPAGKSKQGLPTTDPKELKNLVSFAEVFDAMGRLLEAVKPGFTAWQKNMMKKFDKKIMKEFKLKEVPGSFTVFGEILGSPQVNSLLYSRDAIGTGAFMVFGLKVDDGSKKGLDISTSSSANQIMKEFVKSFDGKHGWKMYFKRPVSLKVPKTFAREVQKFLKKHISELKSLKRNKEAVDKKLKAREALQILMNRFKKNLLVQLEKKKSFLGVTDIEGVIVRNFINGGIFKVVDTEKFTALNFKNWVGRKELQNERKELFKKLIKDVLKNADIFIIKAKQQEKIINYLQIAKKMKFDNLDELLSVIYEDAKNEVSLGSAKSMVKDIQTNIKDYTNLVKNIIQKTKSTQKTKDAIDEKNFDVTIRTLEDEITEMNEFIRLMKTRLKSNQNPYLSLVQFILGPKAVADLVKKFMK